MERTQSRDWESQCIQEQPPACTAACPLHVDARGMIAALARQDFAGAFALYARTVPFPRTLSRICDEPCRRACKRNELDEGILVRALEQACVTYCDKPPKKAPLPPRKSGRVAIVGGSLPGLVAAADLARKGYPVTIFEAGERLGGRLRNYSEEMLPRARMEEDLTLLSELGVKICLRSPVTDPGEITCDGLLAEYDAVILAVAWQQCRIDPISVDPTTGGTDREKLFGGSEIPDSPVNMIVQGRSSAISVDRFLQNASLSAGRDLLGAQETLLYTDLKGISPAVATPLPDRSRGYSREEAVAEATRCLQCQCLECVKQCEFLAHFGGYPKKYIREIYNNDSIVMGIHFANKMINSCALCGQCRVICPNGLDMGKICREARERMVAKGKMPQSAHDFALRDLAFSTGESYTLTRHQPAMDQSRYVFFPGCQLGASAPDHVRKTYEFLRQKLPGGVGLMLNCCGAPAEWAGRRDLFEQVLNRLKTEWQRLGSPTLIAACVSCCRILREQIPEMKVVSLWDILADLELPPNADKLTGRAVCVHDPCSARADRTTQESVRALLDRLGVRIELTATERELTSCCGFGGLVSFANPAVAAKMVKRRSAESPTDFLTYCAMCRDQFAAGGKRTFHLLDLIWGADATAADRPSPGFSDRRENRLRLKQRLLQELWGEKIVEEGMDLLIEIPVEVRTQMEQRMILTDDVRQVIEHAEKSGEKILDQSTGHYIARFRPGGVTYWVEYSAPGEGFIVHNAYSHRMLVVEEAES